MHHTLSRPLCLCTTTSIAARTTRLLASVMFILAALAWSSHSRADPPNAERGRALYENHCQFCHTSKVHSRANKLALTRTELRQIVDNWRRQENLSWSADDTEDVVEYLNRTRYHFPPGK